MILAHVQFVFFTKNICAYLFNSRMEYRGDFEITIKSLA